MPADCWPKFQWLDVVRIWGKISIMQDYTQKCSLVLCIFQDWFNQLYKFNCPYSDKTLLIGLPKKEDDGESRKMAVRKDDGAAVEQNFMIIK